MSDTDDLERIREEKLNELADGSSGSDEEGTPDEPIHAEGADHFGEVVAANDVVLVDFHADWCGPCKMLEPIVADVASGTDAAVLKVDVDAHQGLAGQYGVRGVPTLVLFADGDPVERMVGVQNRGTLMDLVEEHAGA